MFPAERISSIIAFRRFKFARNLCLPLASPYPGRSPAYLPGCRGHFVNNALASPSAIAVLPTLAPQSTLGCSWYDDPKSGLRVQFPAGVRRRGRACLLPPAASDWCQTRLRLVSCLRNALMNALLPPTGMLPLLLTPESPVSGLLRGQRPGFLQLNCYTFPA